MFLVKEQVEMDPDPVGFSLAETFETSGGGGVE